MCKPDINGDAAAFFFLETVRVYAGQSFDQRSFTVIYMAGSSYNDRLHAEDSLNPQNRQRSFRPAAISPLFIAFLDLPTR